MQVFDLQLKLSSIQEELVSILSTFAKPSEHQTLLVIYATYRDNIYKSVTNEYSSISVPTLKASSTSTDAEKKQALVDLQRVINAIESMVIGSVTQYNSAETVYPNFLRESRADLIANLYSTFQIEYDNLYPTAAPIKP
jgi:hypothetical protein